MKGKRLTATMLALLLVVSLLPMAALADDNPAGTTITTTTENIGTNNGTIEENNHTVENNVAVEIPSDIPAQLYAAAGRKEQGLSPSHILWRNVDERIQRPPSHHRLFG